jgi:hypothetical protein
MPMRSPRRGKYSTVILAFLSGWIMRRGKFVTLCAILHIVLASITVWSTAPTSDEPDHIRYGLKILKGDPSRLSIEDSKMPVSAINALPRALASLVRSRWPALFDHFGADIRPSRFFTVAASVALLFVLAGYARQLYGGTASNVVALAYLLSPNVLAHASLSTPDLWSALAMAASTYSFWQFLRDGSGRRMIVSAFLLGLAQLTKTSSLLLFPAQLVVLAACFLTHRTTRTDRKSVIAPYGEYLLWAVAMLLLVINAGFLFRGTLAPLSSRHFESDGFKRLQSISVVHSIPVPLPQAFLAGIDLTQANLKSGAHFGGPYLLGTLRNARDPAEGGFRSYYVVVYLLKEPIVFQIFLLLAFYRCFWRGWLSFCQNELCIFAIGALLFVFLSFFNKAQIGIRHLLPCLALSLVLIGGLFQDWSEWRFSRRTLAVTAWIWLAVSFFSYFPRMIPYTNEFVLNRKQIWRYYADSNLSWGQGEWEVGRFLQHNPDVILNPDQPTQGRILVEANRLTGVMGGSEKYRWLRSREPIGQVAYSHLLFKVSQSP